MGKALLEPDVFGIAEPPVRLERRWIVRADVENDVVKLSMGRLGAVVPTLYTL